MRLRKTINTTLVLAAALAVVVWLIGVRSSQATARPAATDDKPLPSDYVGTEVCKDCHEDQFKAYSHTAHAELAKVSDWKNKVTG